MKTVYSVLVLLWLVCMTGCAYEDQPREIADTVLDSTQIIDCVYDTYNLSSEEYVPVHISAVLDADHRGEWRFQLARKGTKRPDSVFVTVDTAAHKSYDYHTASYDSKLAQAYSLEDVISSERAIVLAEQALSETYDVVYSRMELTIVNDAENRAPLWLVDFDDAFFVRMNAKTGEILSAEA